MDEDALCLDRHAVGVGDTADREGLRPVDSVDLSLRAKALAKTCAADVTQRQCAGDGGLVWFVRGGAENMVEDQRADSPCTCPGGPSYAAPSTKSVCTAPSASWSTTKGGAIGFRRPITTLPNAMERPSGWFARRTIPEAGSRSNGLSPRRSCRLRRRWRRSTSVRMVASISRRTDAVSRSCASLDIWTPWLVFVVHLGRSASGPQRGVPPSGEYTPSCDLCC